MGDLNLILFLERALETTDGKLLYLLTLIFITMCLDFITGTWSAKFNKNIEFKSKIGINGILRKISSLLLMIVFVPFAIAVNKAVGLTLIWTLYLGYEIMELKSITENIDKMGEDNKLFTDFIKSIEKKLGGGKFE